MRLLSVLLLAVCASYAADVVNPATASWAVTKRSAHENNWECIRYATNANTGEVSAENHSYIELASGLNVPQADGSFIPADPALVIRPDGDAEALGGLHKIRLAADIGSPNGAVTIVTPDGATLRGTPIAIGYYCPISGSNVIIATLAESATGWLISPTEVVWSNCFSGVRASIHARNFVGGFAQTLLLHEAPPPPETYGLSSNCWLQLYTEWDSNTPQPAQKPYVIRSEQIFATRQQMVSPDFVDSILSWSTMRMGRGRAFATSDGGAHPSGLSAPVAKAFQVIDQRNILTESVELWRIKDALTNLPPALPPGRTNAAIGVHLPAKRVASAATEERMRRVVSTIPEGARDREAYALALDYEILTSGGLTDYHFLGDVTYYVSGTCFLYGSTVMDGNCVLKVGSSGSIDQVTGTIACGSSDYQPVTWTSASDDSVGERISGSSGVPAMTSEVELVLESEDLTGSLSNMRFAWGYYGILFLEMGVPYPLYNMQFVHCGTAVSASRDTYLRNVLIAKCDAAVENYATAQFENVTVSEIRVLDAGGGSLAITNSLLVAVTNALPTFSGVNNATNGSPANVFTNVGAGSYYLSLASLRSAGTTNIDGKLRTNLLARTTQPPLLLTNKISASTNLSIAVAREGAVPDIGWAYAPLDYAVNRCVITNATLTLNAGVAIAGWGSNALALVDNGALIADGQPLQRVTFTRYNAVQEQTTNWGPTTNLLLFDTTAGTNGKPNVTLRFADLTVPAGGGAFLSCAGGYYSDLSALSCRDSSFTIGSLYFYSSGPVAFTNNLFSRMSLSVTDGRCNYFNNLALNGSLLVAYTLSGSALMDNLFDHEFISENASPDCAFNAYVRAPSANDRLLATNDLVLTNFVYTTGPLGAFYQSSTNLVDQGSRRGTNTSLFHHTTQAGTQAKEGSSIIDIGMHYMALRADGGYIDSDDDGLPDWYENAALDGIAHTNSPAFETDWTRPDTDGDGVGDNALTLSFAITNGAIPVIPKGNLIRGQGFRVWAKTEPSPQYEPNGLISIYLQQSYRGMDLNIYSGDGEPSTYERGIDIALPSLTNTTLKFLVKYDFRSLRFSLSNGSTLVTNFVVWKDNMTESLGTNGPATLWLTNVSWLTNVTYNPAPFARTNGYVWEGVIGNTSQSPSGLSVHSPWWPIRWMVSKGTNVFYSCGFNESKYAIQKFHTANPQFVVTNFGTNSDRMLHNTAYPTNMALKNGTNLYVLYSDGNLAGFDINTCALVILTTNRSLFPNPTSGLRIPLLNSIAVAVHPEATNTAAVYYRTTDQVVVYTNAFLSTWKTNFVIGNRLGYSNGPAILVPTNTDSFRTNVQLSSYYYDSGTAQTNVALCFQSDGMLWVGDTATSRMLRFNTSGLCDTWIMYVAHSYTACADPNDPQRVFMGYLEFQVDYNKPIATSWKLVNYWGRASATHTELPRGDNTLNGLWTVTTLTNQHTYALIREPNDNRSVVELTLSGVRRPTTSSLATNQDYRSQLEVDGSMLGMILEPDFVTGTNAIFVQNSITGWSGNDPLYSTQSIGHVAYTGGANPIDYSFKRSGTNVFPFYPDLLRLGGGSIFTGPHLGSVRLGSPGIWNWTAIPTAPLNGTGTFATNCDYAGTVHTLIDGSLFVAYRGEGWFGGQANQIIHVRTNGTFVGQFGMPRFEQNRDSVPGAAGNIFAISAVATNGNVYLYTNDEWSHGVHRWKIISR